MPIRDPTFAAADAVKAIQDMCTHAAALLDAAEASGNPALAANVRAFVEELLSGIRHGVGSLEEMDQDRVPRLN